MEPVAPAVVAVVVSRDPGPWFEEVLAAFSAQDYPNLSVLVVDAASPVDPTPRVAAVLPSAFVRRLDSGAGFAASANEALAMVEGATHLLLCHDDVAPEPDAIRQMVEESFRSNAGVVAPKLVSWSDPERLLQVGMAADKLGAPRSRVEPGELDQEQHDAVRDVLVAPGGATLVRADLFEALGGFDAEMTLFGEDLDLSWRAQALGSRVVVAPEAKVRHREASSRGERPLSLGPEAVPDPELDQPGDRRGHRGPAEVVLVLRRRHELRAVLKNYGRWHLARVLPQAMALTVAEMVVDLLAGRPRRARALVEAWRWNLARLGQIRAARRQMAAVRRVGDREVRRLQASGSARLSLFVRTRLAEPARRRALSSEPSRRRAMPSELHGSGASSSEPALSWSMSSEPYGRRPSSAEPPVEALSAESDHSALRLRLVAWALIAAALLWGSRHLLGGPFPLVGQLAPFPGVTTLLDRFGSGWTSTGLGSASPAPLAFALLGISGGILGGSVGLLQKILVLGALPVGAIGAYRLARPIGSSRCRLVSSVVYLAIPLPYDALSQGRWDALLVYAAFPWILARLSRSLGVEPFASATVERRRPIAHLGRQALALGVLLALLCAFVPAGAIVTLICAAVLAVVSMLLGQWAAALRVASVAVGGVAVAAVLCFPWSLSFLAPGAQLSSLTGLVSSPASSGLGFGAALRFDTGPLGSAPVGWAFVVVAALALLVGRGWRLTWATRMWGVAIASWGLAWMASRGWLGASFPSPDILLVPAAAGVALSAALGLAAFEGDVPGYRFGWRQGVSLAAGAFALVGLVPVVASIPGGRWNLPSQGVEKALSWLPAKAPRGGFRVLWLGDPHAIPLRGWSLEPGLAYATSESGLPNATELWPSADPGPARLLARAVTAARSGDTTRLGHLLAPLAVRYVVVASGTAPVVPGQPPPAALPPPPGLVSAIQAQDDLRHIDAVGGLKVFENRAWAPERTALSSAVAASVAGSSTQAESATLAGSAPVLPGRPGTTTFEGRVPKALLYWSSAYSPRWVLNGPGETVLRPKRAFGWANAYDVPTSGVGTLSYRTPATRYLAIAVEVVLWAVALAALARRRRGRRQRRSSREVGEWQREPVAVPSGSEPIELERR